MPTPPRRRWYQFSLRTMFVVVTLACIGFGWWVQRSAVQNYQALGKRFSVRPLFERRVLERRHNRIIFL